MRTNPSAMTLEIDGWIDGLMTVWKEGGREGMERCTDEWRGGRVNE